MVEIFSHKIPTIHWWIFRLTKQQLDIFTQISLLTKTNMTLWIEFDYTNWHSYLTLPLKSLTLWVFAASFLWIKKIFGNSSMNFGGAETKRSLCLISAGIQAMPVWHGWHTEALILWSVSPDWICLVWAKFTAISASSIFIGNDVHAQIKPTCSFLYWDFSRCFVDPVAEAAIRHVLSRHTWSTRCVRAFFFFYYNVDLYVDATLNSLWFPLIQMLTY